MSGHFMINRYFLILNEPDIMNPTCKTKINPRVEVIEVCYSQFSKRQRISILSEEELKIQNRIDELKTIAEAVFCT